MPTPNPRLSVVVTPHQRDLLGALGAHQGRSAASYLRSLLDASTPHLQLLLASLDQAARSTADLPAVMAKVSAEIAQGLAPYEQHHADQLDLIADVLEANGLGDLSLAVADLIPRERSEGERGAAIAPVEENRPPYCNTGVRKPAAGGKGRKSAISARG
jgi:hypothetical protein